MFPKISTPSVLIDLDIVDVNISKFQTYCDENGLKVRPHIKTHKLPRIAKQQLAAGAIGITCQKVSEAEAMISEGGIEDVLITYNILGQEKLDRLLLLSQKVRLSVVADNVTVINGLSKTFAYADHALSVLVECDTGAKRCGVSSPAEAASLAREIDELPGLKFAGLMTYPPVGKEDQVQEWLTKAKTLIEAQGQEVKVVSHGGSPGMWSAADVPIATEYRIGTYVYNDRSLVAHGTCKIDECALTVLATVVSVPTKDRAIIDAGSKVLTSDLLGLEGNGHVLGHPDILVTGLSEEHGTLTASNINLRVGDRVRIVPNHACVVTNMLDQVELIRGAIHESTSPVVARGLVW